MTENGHIAADRVEPVRRALQRHNDGAVPSGAVSAELGPAAREALPAPQSGERYHVHGLTELWARNLAEKALADGREPHTARSYTHAVATWLRYCLLHRVDPLRARRADIDDWISRLGVSAATARLRLAEVSNWYGYLLDNEVATTDPAARAERPSRKRADNGSATTYFTDAELNALLTEASRQAETAPAE